MQSLQRQLFEKDMSDAVYAACPGQQVFVASSIEFGMHSNASHAAKATLQVLEQALRVMADKSLRRFMPDAEYHVKLLGPLSSKHIQSIRLPPLCSRPTLRIVVRHAFGSGHANITATPEC